MDINELARYLEQRAIEKRPVYYGEVVNHFGIREDLHPWQANPLCQAFGKLDREDAVKKRPFRTSMVIAQGTNMPGQGYFTALHELRGIVANNEMKRLEVFTKEINAAMAYPWKKPSSIERVYDGLYRTIPASHMSQFIENLLRPHVLTPSLDEGYRAMAADTARETQAREWCNALAGDLRNEAR